MLYLLCASFLFLMSPLHAGLFGAGGDSGFIVRDGVTLSVVSMDMKANSLEIESGGTAIGSFVFTEGTLIKDATKHHLTGTFNATDNKIILSSGKMRAESGVVATPLEIDGSGNIVAGQGRITQDITFTSGAAARFDLQSPVVGDVILTSGTATLGNDLTFGDNHFFVGPGTVTGGTHLITTGDQGVSSSAALSFTDEVSLALQNKLTLGAQWLVSDTLHLHGNAQVVDVTAGDLRVAASATLFLNDLSLNGVTATRLTFADTSGTIQLNNVFFDIDANTTFDKGTVKVTGETTLLLRDKTLSFTGTSSLVVDGATLWYDGTQDFLSDNTAKITLLNGGQVRSILTEAASSVLSITDDTTLTKNYEVDPLVPVTIGGSDTTTLNGAGHALAFVHTTGDQLIVSANVDAVITNTVLSDFVPSALSLGTGASITFGAGTRMELGKDETLGSTLLFSGTTTLDGKNYCLDLGSSGAIQVASAGTLTLKNITLRNVEASNLLALATSSSVVFENVVLELSDDFTFSQGSFDVEKKLLIIGAHTFAYTTAQQSTIRAYSSLILDVDSTFHYNPSGGSTDRLVFTDKTSRLVLSDSVLKVASTGAVLTNGIIVIDDSGTFNSLATGLSGALVLGDGLGAGANVTVRISPHSTLHISNGVVKINDAEGIGAG